MARILALRPPFGGAVQLQAPDFFRRVAETLETDLSVENLADVWNANGKIAEAAALRRRRYDRMPADSPEGNGACEALAMLYRVASRSSPGSACPVLRTTVAGELPCLDLL